MQGWLDALRIFVVALAALVPARDATKDTPPHLILVYADDLGYGDLGCYGNKVIQTPHLDRFAAGGMRFTDFYAGGPNCSPSRAVLVTGRTADRVGIYDILSEKTASEMHLRAEELTIAELLKDEGYATYHAGKWHLDQKLPGSGQALDHGFEVSDQEFADATRAVRNFGRWLAEREDERPVFSFLSLFECHEPVDLRSPQEFRDLYADLDDPEPPHSRRPRRRWEDRDVYYGCVSQLDSAFGELLAVLEREGMRENALVLFTSDNGPENRNIYSFGSSGPLKGTKDTLLEGGIRVPALVQWPGHVAPASVSAEPAHTWDVLPTFCDAAGASTGGAKLDGISLRPLLQGGTLQREHALYWGTWAGRGRAQYALRDGPWKLLAGAEPLPVDRTVQDHIKHAELVHYELYRVTDDPGETRDLAAEEPEVLARLQAELDRYRAEIADEGPDWDLEAYRHRAPKSRRPSSQTD